VAVILLVEDEEQVRVLAESILQEAGHSVVSAAGAEGAKAILESDQPIDILFIDIGLGSEAEAGLAIARHGKEQRPKLRVLYTTGQGVTDGMRALFVEPFEFLSKPYTSDQLQIAIGRVFPT
jgi:DNA-binding NtrC family response regulator